MAVAPARRGPDIIPAAPIPLSAVSDQPLPDAIAPPTSASAHPDDLANGVAKEITAEELAAGDTAKHGVSPAEAEAANAEPKKADEPAGKTAKAADPEYDDGITVPSNLSGTAVREIATIRRRARELVEVALKTAKGEAGEADWQKLYERNRDAIVLKAQHDSAKAAKEAKATAEILTAAQKELEELRAKVGIETKPEVTDPKPERHNFDDPDAFDEAQVAWGKREGVREADAARKTELEATEAAAKAEQAEEARKAQETAVLEIQDKWTKSRDAAIEKYPDYAEVAEADPSTGGPMISEAMAAAIVQVDSGTDVAYHLGQNPEESVRIAAIANPIRQFIEIGRIAERLATPIRMPRRARPVEIISDAPNRADDTDAEPSMEAYAAKRQADLRRDRKPFFPEGGLH